jgi:hypothetical protein
MIDIESEPLRRPRTLEAQRGYDLMRRIVDNIRDQRTRLARPDCVMLSAESYNLMCKSWCEMAPANTPMPLDIDGIKFVVGDTRGHAYVFLRDYIPWEKRRAKANGDNLYGDVKKLIATGDH